MSDPVIALRSVAKSFRKKPVLEDVSLTVAPGQTFAFLGRNGAGKTTTIRMLLGLLKPDSGSISVLGLDPARYPIEVRKRVGYLAEDQTMYGWMTVAQLVQFIAPFYPTWDDRLAAQLLDQFELSRQAKVAHLSKGQNVRLGLLLALAHRPQLVILDDPALGLDPIMRREFNRDLITLLQGEGRAVFYSSHLLYEVEPVADAVAILDRGRIVRQARTEDLRDSVKQITLRTAAWERLRGPLDILDLRRHGDMTAIVVEHTPAAIAALEDQHIEYRLDELNLDEIFEAYVAGRRAESPLTPPSEPVMQSVA